MRDLTVLMIREIEQDAGEAITDLTGLGKPEVFGGFLLGRIPEKATDILGVVNAQYCDDFSNYRESVFPEGKFDTYEEEQADWEVQHEAYLSHLVAFVNLTFHTRKRVLELYTDMHARQLEHAKKVAKIAADLTCEGCAD